MPPVAYLARFAADTADFLAALEAVGSAGGLA
jgi:hypothetical protein